MSINIDIKNLFVLFYTSTLQIMIIVFSKKEQKLKCFEWEVNNEICQYFRIEVVNFLLGTIALINETKMGFLLFYYKSIEGKLIEKYFHFFCLFKLLKRD